jgi:hypothetical protein
MKRSFIYIQIFFGGGGGCFAMFVVQNLPACGRKTEKNKEKA